MPAESARCLRQGLERRRIAFLGMHKALYLTDQRFVRSVFAQTPSLSVVQIAVIVRRVLAAHCEVAPEKLAPETMLSELRPLLCPNASFRSFYRNIAAELYILTGTRRPLLQKSVAVLRTRVCLLEGGSLERGLTVGEWVKQASEEFADELPRRLAETSEAKGGWLQRIGWKVNREDRFLRERRSLYVIDEEFANGAFTAPSFSERHVAVTVRRALAQSFGVAPEKLHHNDQYSVLIPLTQSFGFFLTGSWSRVFIDLELGLGRLLGESVRLDQARIGARDPSELTLGDWVKHMTGEILLHLSEQGVDF